MGGDGARLKLVAKRMEDGCGGWKAWQWRILKADLMLNDCGGWEAWRRRMLKAERMIYGGGVRGEVMTD